MTFLRNLSGVVGQHEHEGTRPNNFNALFAIKKIERHVCER